MREHDRERHELLGLVAGVAEHHPLVTRTLPVERIRLAGIVLHLVGGLDALGDVRGLLVEGDDDAARVGVEAVLGPVVADLTDRAAHQPRDVHVGRRRHLTRDDHQAGGDQRLAGDPPTRVVGEHRIENGVGDLVGNLVGMPLGNRFGREEVLALRHGGEGYWIARKPETVTRSSSAVE